jgi:hypothetical protein
MRVVLHNPKLLKTLIGSILVKETIDLQIEKMQF